MGLTAADVVSKWTWAATLLQSSNVAYKFGVSGPFWYAAGATVQIILFAIVAIEIKRKCPAIHTMLEVVQIRWGTKAHLTFLFFGLLSSLIVTAMLILGGSATINALTGMDTYAASFLILSRLLATLRSEGSRAHTTPRSRTLSSSTSCSLRRCGRSALGPLTSAARPPCMTTSRVPRSASAAFLTTPPAPIPTDRS